MSIFTTQGRYLRLFTRTKKWLKFNIRFNNMTSQPQSTFESLQFDNLVLRTLPVETNEEVYPRNVSGACFSRVSLSPLENPVMVGYSKNVASLLDLSEDELETNEAAEYLSGSKLIPGSELAAHCYCGYQFGYFSGQLGDGAAKYLGEVINARNERWEIQLKGAGITPYSRTADGRKVLRSSLREFLCSEAMHHLGIPTTRALSCVTSDSRVVRDIFYDGHPIMERCTVVCRVAPTFLRFGSFEICKILDDMTGRVGPSVGHTDILKQILEYLVSVFYTDIYKSYPNDSESMYKELYKEIVKRTAHLVAQWQCVGFCHGVLNTDNMSVLGLTIDYGPFGFMDHFNPDYTCNASDDGGRYTYINQPKICEWNLNKLAEALQPVLDLSITQKILEETFFTEYNDQYLKIMRNKLGLIKKDLPVDRELVIDFMKTLEDTGADFTNSFRVLSKLSLPGCKDFQKSLEDVKQFLIDVSCTAEDLKNIHRPSMDESHFNVYIQILSQHPEILPQLGKGAEALKREIEKREKSQQISSLTDIEKKRKDEELWSLWLKKYIDRLSMETEEINVEDVNQQRVEIMNKTNPRFILRNYIAQVAIEAAEEGHYDLVKTVLKILENPYDDNFVFEMGSKTKETKNESEEHTILSYDASPPTWARSLRVT